MKVAVKKVKENAKLPFYATPDSAGCDLHACISEPLVVKPGETVFVPTGLAFMIPSGYAGLIYARSGIACKRGLAPANKVGVVDADYRGEVLVALYNQSNTDQTIEPDERIAQFVITPYLTAEFEEVDQLDDTLRGQGGFGSTNK